MPHVQPEASVVQVGPGLRYIGEHAFAYSGAIQTSTSPVDHLNFQSGVGYILADITCGGAIHPNTPAAGENSIFPITFNDILITTLKTETQEEDMPSVITIRLLIPPFTKVLIKCDSSADTDGFKTSVALVGRVYGAE